MNPEYKFKDDEYVSFDNGVIFGKGHIVGASDTGHPIIGITYMVETIAKDCSVKLPNDTYPFQTIPMSEHFITKIP